MDMKQLEDTGRDPGGTEFLVLLPEEKVTVSVQTNNAIENFDRDFRTKTNYKKTSRLQREVRITKDNKSKDEATPQL